MSLEAKIAELTLAVQALTLAFQNGVKTQVIVEPIVEKTEARTVESSAVTIKQVVVERIPNESSTPVSGAQCEPEPQKSSLTYDDVKRATNNLSAAKGKEITIAALARFGVKRATELTESQWQEYCDYTAKCVAGLDPREAA